MSVLIMIRHGESTANVQRIVSHDHGSYPLTEKGRAQASVVGEELMGLRLGEIYSSPILRARETADIIASKIGCEVVIDDRIRERSFGRLNNKKVDSINWKVLLAEGTYEGVESWDEISRRADDFLQERCGEIIVMVSHYDPIRVILSKQLGLEDEINSWGVVVPNASGSIMIRNGSMQNKVIAIGIPPIEGLLKKSLQTSSSALHYSV
jgi:probable phosphoglycerate mutase